MIFEFEDDLDRELHEIDARWEAVLSGKPKNSAAECYKILDPFTANKIQAAATRAHWGEEYAEWAEQARTEAGYDTFDLRQDPR